MNKELPILQEVLENMTEKELQSLDLIDQESTIHEHVAVGVEQEHTVGLNASDPMMFDIS